jgi:amino acid transporter
MTCLFGIAFILFGNMAGNSIQFGIYMQAAISPNCTEDDPCFNKTAVLLWAVGVLCFCSLLNITTRSLFITLNNVFGIAKVLLIVITIFLGIIYGSIHGDGCRTNITWSNQGTGGGELGDIVLAMFYAMFSYTGFEQPFYVLAEVRQPRQIFAKYVLIALASVIILFPLTNVGFFCVVPYQGTGSVPPNMALKFFDIIARGGDATADTTTSQRAISAILGVVIVGNIMAQTFTGTRVKQEIGKEAILPFSLAFATGSDSLAARLLNRGHPREQSMSAYIADHPEQVPIAATFLHTIVAIILVILAGTTTKPSIAYRILTYLRVFTAVVVLGLLTVAGLAYLRIDSWWHGVANTNNNNNSRHNNNNNHNNNIEGGPDDVNRPLPGGRRWLAKRQWPTTSRPWLDPIPSFVAAAVLAFMSLASFVPPSKIRPDDRSIPSWIYPLTGWLSLGLGILWWAGLRGWQWKTRTITLVTRVPHINLDGDRNAVLVAEVFMHEKIKGQDADTFELESHSS